MSEAWAGFLDPARLRDCRPEEDVGSTLLAQALEIGQLIEWLLADGPGGWEGLSGPAWADLFRSAIGTALAELDRIPLLETERKAQATVAAEQLRVLQRALELPAMRELFGHLTGAMAQTARQAEVETLLQLRQQCLDLIDMLKPRFQPSGLDKVCVDA